LCVRRILFGVACLLFMLGPARVQARPPELEILETAPAGTELDLPDIRNAIDVLPDLFARAEFSIDVAQMYMLYYRPESRGALLFSLYDALVAAAGRGVSVRILLDSTTLEDNPGPTYTRMRDSLSRFPGIAVRAVDLRPYSAYPECMMHAKYVIIDKRIAVIGSHNWSFSAFADNRELSVLVPDSAVARQLASVFETDWRVARGDTHQVRAGAAGKSELQLVVTSPSSLADGTVPSTVHALQQVFGSAVHSLDLEVNSLTTRVDFGPTHKFVLLDSLLRRTAARGVRIRVLVDKWAYDFEPGLFRSLNRVENITVRIIDIAAVGPNPATGSVHDKLVIADDKQAFLGSATFSQRQLLECRNVGLLIADRKIVAQLRSVFERDWDSHYCYRP
jgi:phosphatidylserine/phosphatidylglycerophosphate/cardiolipin synthase-like enzyme